uniref:Cytochrome c oxidase subunit 3 n=1 Tax=Orthogonalys pulchella TaxID=32427 RepID=A0A096XMY9_9HYME|nr:cytochrome c oxidase subunit III [Orthogonalys pulchella]AIC37438.1 cytochrome c oxidase subunit III [Orthogonalys pulchella]
MKKNFNHPFHMVSVSPWPLLVSLNLLLMMMSFIYYLQEFELSYFLILLISLILLMYQWWRDVVRESLYQGEHTIFIVKMLKLGMFLFILSELFFFVSFFWSYFHFYLSPSIDIGSMWPPKGVKIFNPMNIPLLNTVILISSGVTLTYSHYNIIMLKYYKSMFWLFFTILLGLYFSVLQWFEYEESYFSMWDSVYGSNFFLMTGFHGLHVIIGTIFLFVCFIRLMFKQFSLDHHFGFEGASWYWHFVDIVWLFLYMFVYWLPF